MGRHDPIKRSPRLFDVIVICHLHFILCPLVEHDVQTGIGGIKGS